MTDAFRTFLVSSETFAISYFVVVNTIYALLLMSAALQVWWHRKKTWGESFYSMMRSPFVPRISILAPAHNEELSVVDSVRGHLTLHYPDVEVVVANDGSSDGTMSRLIEAFDLEPVPVLYEHKVPTAPVIGAYRSREHTNLLVIDKQNGGKADALNAALNACSGELVCSIDADTIIEPEALARMVRPFADHEDVLASGGTIRVANGSQIVLGRVTERRQPRPALALFQSIEYARAFLSGRLGWNRLGGNLVISGAFGLFRTSTVRAVGGYERDTVAEDMELVVRLRRHARENRQPDRVEFQPDPVAWTEVPETLRVLGRQRDRWHRGLAHVMWQHGRLMFRPRYGPMAFIGLPYYFFIELLAPLIEALGIVLLAVGLALGAIDVSMAVLFFLLAYGYGMVLTLATLFMQEAAYEITPTVRGQLKAVTFVLAESLGYRQLTVYWRVKGLIRFVLGSREWGEMTRRGFGR